MSYDASLYMQLHRGTPGDLAFYLEHLKPAQHILELGCGYGRILSELARAGHQVTGLDLDADMLALAADARSALPPELGERITLLAGDMRNFQLEQTFDAIIIAFNSLYCMLSEDAVIDCLRCARAHLSKGGEIIFDGYAIDYFHLHADPLEQEDESEALDSLQYQGQTYDIYERCHWDRDAQRLDVTYHHIPRSAGETLLGSVSHRYLLTHQVEGLMAQAGLKVTRLLQDFDGTALGEDPEHMICVAQCL